MSLVSFGLKKSVSLQQSSKSRGRASVRRRSGGYRPELLALEARLPLGDAFLGLMAGSWLLGPSGFTSSAAGETSPGNTAVHPVAAQTPCSSCWDERFRGEATSSTSAFSLFAGDLFEARLSDFTGAFAGPAPKPSRAIVHQVWPDEAFPASPTTTPREIVAPVSSQTGSAARSGSSSGFVPVSHGTRGDTTAMPLLTTAAASPDAALHATVAQGEVQPDTGAAGPKQPNIVFIITDDQDTETLAYMPRLQALLGDQGVTFANAFVALPVCCPSHVSVLTGQYPHNHGIRHNIPPLGGWQLFHDRGQENSTIATWMQDAGYHTGRIGKYLVGYPDDSTYVPPGWDEWYSSYGGFGRYFNYSLNENGTVVRYGDRPEDYSTDVYAAKMVDFIERAEAHDEQPFLLFFAPSAPHGDGMPNGRATPAPRHAGMFEGVTAPRPPSFNEADVSDKPPAIRDLPLLTDAQIAEIDIEYQTRLESLQAVDEGIERIIDTLAERGELENTYLVYTSDNGYHLGQHRLLNGKGQLYEEDIRVPLLVRGPGVPAGVTREEFAMNIDFAPTFAELGGAKAADFVDGRSLVPLLGEGSPRWRRDFLVEMYRIPEMGGDELRGLRTRDRIYIEYLSGPRELYDLHEDPYQLDSLHETAPPGQLRRLSRRLAELATCAGETCRE